MSEVIAFSVWCSSAVSNIEFQLFFFLPCTFELCYFFFHGPEPNRFLCGFRWESNRTRCGPQTGAEGAGWSVHLPAKTCSSVPHQCQDLLDCECLKGETLLWLPYLKVLLHSLSKLEHFLNFCILGHPPVTLCSGLPYLLSDYWQLLDGPRRGGHIWL